MFQFSAFAFHTTILQIARLPHSEIHGSVRICQSPKLIAAYHVLHRLWEPRHPPCALIYFLHPLALLLARKLHGYAITDIIPTVVFSCNFFSLSVCQRTLFPVSWSICIHTSPETWRITDSNRWPPACKAGALASWANSPYFQISDFRPETADTLLCPNSHISILRSLK